jgi:hypothetical protein
VRLGHFSGHDYNPRTMPIYQDAYISDIVVVVAESADNPFDKVLDQVKNLGMHVESVNKDEGVIEGSVDAGKVKAIDDLSGVEYVRSVFTYIADYPPGDPRDQDKVAREYDEV